MQLQHQKITLDVNDTRAFTVLNAHQGDSKTRFIDITLTESGNTITLSSNYVATVKASINNKTKAVNTAVVNTTNNIITVELTKTMLDTPGLLNCEVILQDNQQFVTSATFTVKVAESVISDETEIVASQEFGKLLDALIEIKDIEDKADRVQTLVDNIDKLESADEIVTRLSNVESKETQLETQHRTDVQALADKANSIVDQANTDRQNFNNSVDEINTTLDTKENVSNKVSEITHPSLDYYPDTKAVFDYVNSKLEVPLAAIESLKADKLDKTDFNSYKTSNDNAVNSKVDTTDFNTYKTSTNKAIEANTTAIDKCVTDLSVSSTGYYNVDCNYKIGSIDKVTGEEKDGPAFITDKLDLSQYSNVTITTDKPTLYASVFEYDSNNKFTKVIADTKNKIIFSPVAGYKYIIWLWYGGTDFSKITEAHIKGKSINTIAENDTRYIINKEECKLDLPDNYYMQKGETLELFKYGMYLSTSEYVENKYNVRLVNMGGYVTEYSDKIVITCPADYDSDLLRKPNDLPLFQLLNNEGKVIDSKRVKIYVTDISKIHNITKNIMYLGDSLTGMGYRSAEMANLIKSTNLTNVKLIGRSIGQGTGNRFTGTGGYTWANYTENPNSLPSAYGNNYLWVNEYNNISMGHFVKYDLGESQLDYLIILLGWNDYESGAFSSSFNWEDLKTRARKLIENTHASFPSCKIILEGYHYMYPHNRQSYGNSMPQIRQNRYIYDLNKVYESLAKEYEYVIFVQMSNRIDVIHNMPMKEVTANKRNKTLVSYCTDCVHPAESGFNQYADAEFDSILYLMAKES